MSLQFDLNKNEKLEISCFMNFEDMKRKIKEKINQYGYDRVKKKINFLGFAWRNIPDGKGKAEQLREYVKNLEVF